MKEEPIPIVKKVIGTMTSKLSRMSPLNLLSALISFRIAASSCSLRF